MNFIVEGKTFQQNLQSVNKVINSKNALTILDNMLFKLENGVLYITGSDQENTLTVKMDVVSSEGEGMIALSAKTLLEITKEISSQPITFEINESTNAVELKYHNGHFSFMGINGSEYPSVNKVGGEDEEIRLTVPASVIKKGIERTVYAVSTDTIRPAMMGIFWDIHNEDITFVSSDTHKLVRYINTQVAPGVETSFIMPAKPATVLMQGINDEDANVEVVIRGKNATFTFENKELICRFVNGNYPAYNRVIPTTSAYRLTVDRQSLLNALRRVALFASKSSSLVRFDIDSTRIKMSGSDLDYSTYSEEEVMCEYDGNPMVIGFNSQYTLEILQNIGGETTVIEITDPARPGIFLPLEKEEGHDIVTIQMPIQVLE